MTLVIQRRQTCTFQTSPMGSLKTRSATFSLSTVPLGQSRSCGLEAMRIRQLVLVSPIREEQRLDLVGLLHT